jgi:hypothetical protein
MPMFTCSAELFTVHERQAAKSINDFQMTEMFNAMKAFLKACLPRIPKRTGFIQFAFKGYRDYFRGAESGPDLNPALAAFLYGELSEETNATPGTAAKQSLAGLQGSDNRGRQLSPAGREARLRQYEREQRANLRRFRKTKGGKRKQKLRYQEYYYEAPGRRIAKTPANARKFVKPQNAADVITGQGLNATIQFDVAISYYRINDFFSRISGAPWRSMDAGFIAALNYLEVAARNYPYLNEVLVTQRIWLRGSRVGKSSGEPNMAADYRRRFGSQFHQTSSGNLIPEGSISQNAAPLSPLGWSPYPRGG